MIKFIFLAIAIHAIGARDLSNPLLSDYWTSNPNIVLHEGLYYAFTAPGHLGSEQAYVDVSTDLQKWEFNGSLITNENYPAWTDDQLYDAEVHVLGEKQFRLYFSGTDRETNDRAIGAAVATSIRGPYSTLAKPIMPSSKEGKHSPTVFYDLDKLFMLWSDRSSIYAQLMNEDGLSFTNDEIQVLLKKTVEWETDILNPYVIKKKNYYYMFYSGTDTCSEHGAIGVARSESLLGPYVKYEKNPIVKSTSNWNHVYSPGVVTDIDGVSDVLIYDAKPLGQCMYGMMHGKTITWDSLGWPSVA